MNINGTVLVVGATGQQGGAVARKLLEHGARVRGLTRKAESPAARNLERLGAELRQGDLADHASLDEAVRGVDSVFIVTTPFEQGVDSETAQGIAMVDSAERAGVDFIVYSSVGNADTGTGIPHFDSKYRVEQHIRNSRISSTVVAPVYFFDNLIAPWTLPGLKEGRLAAGYPADLEIQQVAVDDIASFATLAISNPGRFSGKRVDIASDELSGAQQAQVIARLAGREIKYVQQGRDQLSAFGGEDMLKMVDWIERGGFNVDIEALRREYPEAGWQRFDEWAARRDWSEVAEGATSSHR